MDTLKAIFTRRSIRKYSAGNVSNENLEVLLRAAMHAPSARNKQPWQFVVITDKDILYKLGGTHPYGKMLMDAGAVWLGLHPREDRLAAVKEILNLPDHILPVSMISIGTPDEIKEKDERYLMERIHINQW
jgi:nitroreductase